MFIVYRAEKTYVKRKTAVKDYENGSKVYRYAMVFSVRSPSTSAASDVVNYTTKVMVRPDFRVRNVDSKIYTLSKQLEQLMLMIKKSIEKWGMENGTATYVDKQNTCSYWKECGQFANQCPKSSHRNKLCKKCGKIGYEAATCWSKEKKETLVNIAQEIYNEAEKENEKDGTLFDHGGQVAVIIEDTDYEEADEAVLAVKRGMDWQPLKKNRRHESAMDVARLLNPKQQLLRTGQSPESKEKESREEMLEEAKSYCC